MTQVFSLNRALWGLAAGLLLAVAVYALLGLWSGGGWAAHIREVPLQAVAVAVSLASFNFLFRFLRWHWFLRAAGVSLGAGVSAWIFLGGLAFAVTPGKAGEAVKSVFCNSFGVPHRTTLAVVWLERLFDLVAVTALFSLGLAWLGRGFFYLAAITWIFLGVLVWLVHAASGRRLLLRLFGRLGRPAGAWFTEMDRLCTRPGPLLGALALSIAGWLCEGIAFWWILRNLSVPAGMAFSQSAYFAATLAGVFFPGGLGGTEGALALALRDMALPAASGAAIALIRAATLGWATAVGLAAAFSFLAWRGIFKEKQPE